MESREARTSRRKVASARGGPRTFNADVLLWMKMQGIATLLCLLIIGCASAQQARVSLPTTHTVQCGETLAIIAVRYYGQENRSTGIKAIVKANPQIGRGPGIQTRLLLTIPELSNETDSEPQGGGYAAARTSPTTCPLSRNNLPTIGRSPTGRVISRWPSLGRSWWGRISDTR